MSSAQQTIKSGGAMQDAPVRKSITVKASAKRAF